MNALELESRSEEPLCDMEREEYLNRIQSLQDVVVRLKEIISYLRSVYESDLAGKAGMQSVLVKLTSEISCLREELSKANDRNQGHNKHSFGKSSLKSGQGSEEKQGREEEKQEYSTPDSLPGKDSTASAPGSSEVDNSKVTSGPLDGKRGPRRPGLSVIDGTHFSAEFLASLAVDRYRLHLPVYRELLRLAGEKMSVCRQTVSNWLRKGHEFLLNLLPSLKALLLRSKSILHIDETRCRVRIVENNFKNGRYFKKYVWVLVNKLEKLVYFLYDNDEDDSRATRPISGFLEGFTGGIQTDAYTVYRFFTEDNAGNERSLCWAHVRAKFKYAADISHDKDAAWFVEQTGRLYLVEVENRIGNRITELPA